MDWARTLRWYKPRFFKAIGYDRRNWSRVAQQRSWREQMDSLPLAALDAAEISSGGFDYWKPGWRSYVSLNYPAFDICSGPLPDRQFDAVIADQVLEHVPDPELAVRNISEMLKPGGIFFVATPFMVRVHAYPSDFSRWTKDGLRNLLLRNGFDSAEMHAWGNRAIIRAHLTKGEKYKAFGWGRDLRNEDDFPWCVWAFARKAP